MVFETNTFRAVSRRGNWEPRAHQLAMGLLCTMSLLIAACGRDAAEVSDAEGASLWGTILVKQPNLEAEGFGPSASAMFDSGALPPPVDALLGREAGCWWVETSEPEDRDSLSVGRLQIVGGVVEIPLVRTEGLYEGVAEYHGGSPPSRAWLGEQTLRAVSSGGTLAAFDIPLRAASGLTIRSPSLRAVNQRMALARDRDLDIAWDAPESDESTVEVLVQFEQQSQFIRCYFPAKQYRGVVPAELLQTAKPGSAGELHVSLLSWTMYVSDAHILFAALESALPVPFDVEPAASESQP